MILSMLLGLLAHPGQTQEPAKQETAHVIFLGTGAADIKTPESCGCENCTYIREHGGSNWRRNSSLFVYPDIVIDYSSSGRKGLATCGVKPQSVNYLLLTHSHGDHCNPAAILDLAEHRAKSAQGKLQVFGDATSIGRIKDFLAEDGGADHPISFVALKPYQDFKLGDWSVKSLPANHDPAEECLLYLFSCGDKSFLYATDTGWFPSGTFAALTSEKLDLAIVEGTFGELDDAQYLTGHMNFVFDRLIRKYLISQKILKPTGKFAVTHLSLHWCAPHDKIVGAAAKEGIVVPHDGQWIDL